MKYFKVGLISIGIIILTYVVSYIVKLFYNNILKIHGLLSEKEIITATIIRDLMIILVCFGLLKALDKTNILVIIKINKFFKQKKIGFIIMMVLSTMFLGGALSGIVGIFIKGNNLMLNMLIKTEHSLLSGIFIIIIAPIFEEIIFRGIIFGCLKKYCSIPIAIIIQAVLFGIFHGDISQGVYAFVLGIVLAIIYLYTDSLWGDILSHGFANLLSVMIFNKMMAVIVLIVSIISIIVLVINRKKYIYEVKKHLK